MTLSCECDLDRCDWFYNEPTEYSTYPFKRRRRCVSCNELIELESCVVTFPCYRTTDYYDLDVAIADKFMCEECGDLYFSLTELGFCVMLDEDNMKEMVKEYAEVYGK